VETRYRAGDMEAKRYRTLAKIGNFGFAGGLNLAFVDYARGYGVSITEEEAKKLRRDWFAQWPAMESYFAWVGSQTGDGAAVATQYRSGRRRGGCSFTVLANTLFQGLVADGAKLALWRIWRECGPGGRLAGSWPVLFIHDEIILETPLDLVDSHSRVLCQIMVEAMAEYIPDVKITASPVAMSHWSKGAKEVRDSRGRLQVWAPSSP